MAIAYFAKRRGTDGHPVQVSKEGRQAGQVRMVLGGSGYVLSKQAALLRKIISQMNQTAS